MTLLSSDAGDTNEVNLSDLRLPDAALGNVLDGIEARKAGQKVSTGLVWLDHLLGGGLPNQSLVIISGVPGAGKSTLSFHMTAEAVRRESNAMLVCTTNQPISKLRKQYGNLNFLGPTGALDKLEFFSLDTGVQETTLNNLLNTIVGAGSGNQCGCGGD